MKAIVAVLLSVLSACALVTTPQAPPSVTHGVAAGEVTSTTALIWGRCDRAASMHVEDRISGDPTWHVAGVQIATPEHDFTTTVALAALRPATTYEYRVSCESDSAIGQSVTGNFRTAPPPEAAAPVTFAWSGDVGGQNVCRDREMGYPIFTTLAAQHADFFVALGDMIYGDDPCRATGRLGNAQIPGPSAPASDVAGYWGYWKYNREDDGLRQLLGSTATYAVWDDHEVRDDFGPADDTNTAGHHLMPAGLQAFRDYNPLAAGPLYRRIRWGSNLDLFLLDTRSFRDANSAVDDANHPKTMLGSVQREWLKAGLAASTATWKVVVTSVPITIPSGKTAAHDGWANGTGNTGFENELLDILRDAKQHGVRNQLWITTDVHFASIQHVVPFSDEPRFDFHEVSVGPLNAGVFPKLELDPTLHPSRIFVYPTIVPEKADLAQALSWFSFGQVAIDVRGRLKLDIRGYRGERLYELNLPPK